MDTLASLVAHLGPLHLTLALAIMLLAGTVKGAVGFALPLIAVAGLGSFLPAEYAIASIILPSLVTNVWQSLGSGLAAAGASARRYALMLAVLVATIAVSAQLVAVLPDRALFGLLGLGVTVFSAVQLAGWRMPVPEGGSRAIEVLVALVAGFFGGLAGVWGPPIILYLVARATERKEQVRILGIAFLAGSITLTLAHGQSGLLSGEVAVFSALMVLPAGLGMWLGSRVQDRLDPVRFRRATLAVLVLAGLNLLRRAVL